MSEKKRPNYTKEFKKDTIKLVIEQRYNGLIKSARFYLTTILNADS